MARYYNPAIGRFISEDPIQFEGGVNFYMYAADNPSEYIDPSGLLVQGRCEPIGWNGSEKKSVAMFNRHCFIRTQCDRCGEKFDKTVEVGGTKQGGKPPLKISNFDGKRGSHDIWTIPDRSDDCHLERCVIEKAPKVAGGISYDFMREKSNTFVHRLLDACGMNPYHVSGGPPVGW